MIVLRNGQYYHIEKVDTESYEIFYKRVNYIIQNYTKYNYSELVKLSKIYVNELFFNTKYI